MDNYEYLDDRTGKRYVVTRNANGTIIAACGPLHYSEILDAIENGFDSDPDLVDDLRAAEEAEQEQQ